MSEVQEGDTAHRVLKRCERDPAAVKRQASEPDLHLMLVPPPLRLPLGLGDVHPVLGVLLLPHVAQLLLPRAVVRQTPVVPRVAGAGRCQNRGALAPDSEAE